MIGQGATSMWDKCAASWVRVGVSLALLMALSGCGIRTQPSNAMVDQVAGRGPLLLVADDGTLPSVRFVRQHQVTSASLGRLIAEQGLPDGVSVERQFLYPLMMRLFYTVKGQVYILERVRDEWFVIGSEQISDADVELIKTQRTKRAQTVADARDIAPQVSSRAEVQPVNHNITDGFRGRLKMPAVAEVARFTRLPNGDYAHTVTFFGETLFTIADWYTDDGRNASIVALRSKRSLQQPLQQGERIIIPASIITNRAPLPEAMVP